MRFDTVFNDLSGRAVATRKVVVYGDGKPWRPVVHVKDLVRAFAAALEAPRELVHNEAFNTGAEHLNHQVGELARIAVEAVPGCELEVLGQAGRRPAHVQGRLLEVGAHVPRLRVRVDARARGARAARGVRVDRPAARGLRGPALHPAQVAASTCSTSRRARLRPALERAAGRGMIDGVKIVPLRQIVDERGKIMHMLKRPTRTSSSSARSTSRAPGRGRSRPGTSTSR